MGSYIYFPFGRNTTAKGGGGGVGITKTKLRSDNVNRTNDQTNACRDMKRDPIYNSRKLLTSINLLMPLNITQ